MSDVDVAYWINCYSIARDENFELKKENRKLREGLEFYTNFDNDNFEASHMGIECEAGDRELGETAREILKDIKEK